MALSPEQSLHHPEALLWLHQKLVSQRKAEA